jgi:hypothetical protein
LLNIDILPLETRSYLLPGNIPSRCLSHIAADRDKGLARAGDRASAHAQSHSSTHSKRGEHLNIGHEV